MTSKSAPAKTTAKPATAEPAAPAPRPSTFTAPIIRAAEPAKPASEEPGVFSIIWGWGKHNRWAFWGYIWRILLGLFAIDNIARVVMAWDIIPGMALLYSSVSLGLTGLLGNDASRVGAVLFFGEALIFVIGLYLDTAIVKKVLPNKGMKFSRVPATAKPATAEPAAPVAPEPVKAAKPAPSNPGLPTPFSSHATQRRTTSRRR